MRLGQTSFIQFSSRLGSSIIGFLATVYFARELGSEVLGVFFLTLATVAWLKLACDFGITQAVTKRVSERRGTSPHVFAGLILLSVTVFFTSVAVILLRDPLNRYLGEPLYQIIIWLLAAQVAYSFVGSVLRGEHLVHVEGILGVSQTITRSTIQVVAVYLGFGVIGLLVGEVAGFVLMALVGTVLLFWYFDRPITPEIPDKTHFYSLLKFAKFSWLGQLRGRSYNMMDTIILGLFVPSGLIGIYAICWNISATLDIFAKSVSTSFFPEVSRLSGAEEEHKVADYLTDSLSFAGLFIIPGFVGAIVVGEGILNMYGSEFTRGYEIMLLLIAATLFNSYHAQLINTLDAIDRPDLSFRVNAFFVLANVGLNILLVYYFGWIGAAVATLLSVFLALVISYELLSSLIVFQIPYGEVTRQTLSAILMGGLLYTVLWTFRSIGVDVNRVLPVLSAVVFGVIVYFSVLLVLSSRFRSVVSENVPMGIGRHL